MSKTIDTLVTDIYSLFDGEFSFDEGAVTEFGHTLAKLIASRVEERKNGGSLRMSNLGTPCKRKLWFEVNHPDLAEKLTGQTRFKFLYGDLVEALVLFLAKAAGHEVVGEQDEMEIEGVKGHRDAVIDGVLVDVKSASPAGFKKFAAHTLPDDDSFGYMDQLFAYLWASQDDPALQEKGKAAFLAVDKTLGHMAVDMYPQNSIDYKARVTEIKELVNNKTSMPERGFSDVPEGKSGNRKLGISCSYCPFKGNCWPVLEKFIYAKGPVWLTHVARPPRVEQEKKLEKF